jgi:simple sugar transport system substrate-binding protein
MRFGTTVKAVAFAASVLVLATVTGVGTKTAAAEDKINIIMLGGPLWDPFFGAMKKGGDDAARDLNVDYQWVTGTDPNNFLADYAKLVKQSASRKPAALVIGNYFPDTLDPMIKEITASGIPVIIQHDGGASWQDVGAVSCRLQRPRTRPEGGAGGNRRRREARALRQPRAGQHDPRPRLRRL